MARRTLPHVPLHRLPLRHLGLRARMTLAFAFGALVLSVMLSVVTYGLVRENVVGQKERAAISQVYFNAEYVRDALRTDAQIAEVLNSLQTPESSRPVLLADGLWFAVDPLRFGEKELPVRLRELVTAGRPARMSYQLEGETELAVGVPIPSVNAAYFEIVSFAELDSTLRSLAVSLLAASLVTTLAGAALGAWASGRVLRPLADVSQAAQAISLGRLETRVQSVRDSDLDRLVRSFNDMARALEERIERDARFASDVSHELRSPLTTLSASIEVLQSRRDELPERSQLALDLLVADVARFQRMVEDLLEISRFDGGAARLDLEEVRIGELVLHTLAATTDDDFPVEIRADAGDVVVMADKRRLVRVLANLVDNATKHGGGVTRVVVERTEHRVEVAVEDAGPGVPIEERTRIFERFSRGGAAGRRGSGDGIGLGLSLVEEHVRLHGGRVRVEDGVGGAGARFVVELPVAAEPILVVPVEVGV